MFRVCLLYGLVVYIVLNAVDAEKPQQSVTSALSNYKGIESVGATDIADKKLNDNKVWNGDLNMMPWDKEKSENSEEKGYFLGTIKDNVETFTLHYNNFVQANINQGGADLDKLVNIAKGVSRYCSYGLNLAIQAITVAVNEDPKHDILNNKEFSDYFKELKDWGDLLNKKSKQDLQELVDYFKGQYEKAYLEADTDGVKTAGGPLVNYGENIETQKECTVKTIKFKAEKKIFLDFWSGGVTKRINNRVSSQLALRQAIKYNDKIKWDEYTIYSWRDKITDLVKDVPIEKQQNFEKAINQEQATMKGKDNENSELVWEAGDTVQIGIKYSDGGKNKVAILNFADANEPGAGWWFFDGAITQEEAVARQTDLFVRLNYIAKTVYQDVLQVACRKIGKIESCPKFDVPEKGVIYLKDVQLLTTPVAGNYKVNKAVEYKDGATPNTIDVIVSAALDYSADTWASEANNGFREDVSTLGAPDIAKRVVTKYILRGDQALQPARDNEKGDGPSEGYKNIQLSKIRAQLYSAIQGGAKIVVLGKQGGGAFRNDNKVVADLYAYVLFSEGMIKYFDKVVFAELRGDLDDYKTVFSGYGSYINFCKNSCEPSRRRLKSLDPLKLQELRNLLLDAFPEENAKAKPVPVFSGKHRRRF